MLRRGRCQLSSVKSACFMQPAYWEPRMTWDRPGGGRKGVLGLGSGEAS